MFIITSNPETFTYGIKDEEINEMLLDDNSTLIPDGIAIVKASKKLGFDVKERITGIDLSEELLKICDKNKYNLALLGASREVIDKLVEIIHVKYPNIKILGISEDEKSSNGDYYIFSKNDIKIGLVNFYGHGKKMIPKDKQFYINMMTKEKVKEVIRKLSTETDFVIVCVNWGTKK